VPDRQRVRDRIIEASRPFLQPDEQVVHVVRALEGPNRWIALALAFAIGVMLTLLTQAPLLGVLSMWLVYTRLYARRIVLATDQAVVLLAGSRWRFLPRSLIQRFPVDTMIGPLKGLFLQADGLGRRLYIVPRTMREVVAADRPIIEDDGR
jgi:hypothetical protein